MWLQKAPENAEKAFDSVEWNNILTRSQHHVVQLDKSFFTE